MESVLKKYCLPSSNAESGEQTETQSRSLWGFIANSLLHFKYFLALRTFWSTNSSKNKSRKVEGKSLKFNDFIGGFGG